MAQVYELFAGRAGRDEVLAAAGREPTPDARRLARFYARLYLGLFAEAGGDLETARREVREAVALGAGGFMADVARIHLEILDASGRAGSPPPGGSP
jgi:hypothetical protein